jgi:DNA-binding HxlR family transcriptional regulator
MENLPSGVFARRASVVRISNSHRSRGCENGTVGSSAKTEYCAFTKAVEHLGDRWSFLIVRELAMFGPQGFNTLASGLPGRVSRSVLADKLRKLEELGLVARDRSTASRSAPYCLTPAGEQLMPTLQSLWRWAEKWVPEDPAMAKRDPSVILWWLSRRVDGRRVPEQQVAVEIAMRGNEVDRCWLLLASRQRSHALPRGPAPRSGPIRIRRGRRVRPPPHRPRASQLDHALADGSVRLFGEPGLVASLPGWFLPVEWTA